MNCKLVLCALALGVLASVNARSLAQNGAGASCAAAGFLQIFVTDGVCEGEAEITCDAAAESESAFKVAVKEWYAEDYKNLCVEEKLEAAAIAFGKAVAKLFARALAKVRCSENAVGRACAWGIGKGSAWAVATAKAIAIAAVDLGPDRAICESDITALSGVFADAAGKAQAAACAEGGQSESDYQRLYLEATSFAVADALAIATAQYCDRGDEVIAKSNCKGIAQSSKSVFEKETGSGTGDASGAKIPACSGAGDAKCCPKNFRFSNCNCRDCNGPWARLQDYSSNGQRTWEDLSGNACFCA